MIINIVEESTKKAEIPKKLVEVAKYNEDEIVRSRDFVMSGMGPMVAINGKHE